MKKTFSILGLLIFVIVLSGCGKEPVPANQDVPVDIKADINPNNAVPMPATSPAVVLPENVITQPGKTVDDEISNIDRDLQNINEDSLNEGLSDADLGL